MAQVRRHPAVLQGSATYLRFTEDPRMPPMSCNAYAEHHTGSLSESRLFWRLMENVQIQGIRNPEE